VRDEEKKLAAGAVSLSIPGLSPDDLQHFTDLPQQIVSLLGPAKSSLDSIRGGSDATNPLSGVFTTISSLAENAGNLPSLDAVVQPFQSLLGQLPTGALADSKEVSAGIQSFLGLLGPFVEAVASGKLDQVFQEALQKGLDFAGKLRQSNDSLATVERELSEFFRLFQSLLGWGASPPAPAEVAQLLSRALGGVPHDLLAGVQSAFQASLTSLTSLNVTGPDIDLWRGLPAQQTAFWTEIDTRVSSGSIDWPQLAADLRPAHATVVAAVSARDRAFAAVLSAATAIRLPAPDALVTALQSIPKIQPPVKVQPIFDGLRRQIQGMADEFENFNLSDADIRQFGQNAADFLLGKFEESLLGRFRQLLVNFQQQVIAAIESLPFARIAQEAHQGLRKVADAITQLDPDVIRKPIHDFFAAIESAVQAISSNSVVQAIHDVWQKIEDAINAVVSQIQPVLDTLHKATAAIQGFAQHVGPALSGITTSVTQIGAQLDAFDLEEAAATAIDALHKIRDTVAGIDVSKLPAPAVSAIKAGADALQSIDIAGTVNGPLTEALKAVDPTDALNAATDALKPVVVQLKAIDPISLSADLDNPVNELLSALNDFGPDQLRKIVDDALRPVRDAINGIDIASFLAPLTQAYGQIAAKIDGLLNPDPIFQPLEELFKPVNDAIDAIDPSKLIARILPHDDSVGSSVGQNLQPPGPVAAAKGVLRDAFAPAAEAQDELFGFRPGDFLIPLIDLHRKLMDAVNALSDDILEPAARELENAFAAPLRDLHPEAFLGRIRATLEQSCSTFDPAASSTALITAATSFHSAAGRIALAARADLSAGDKAASIEIVASLPSLDPLLLIPDAAQSLALRAACSRAEASLDLTGLRNGFATFQSQLKSVLPEFLTTPDLGANDLKAALAALDPAPVRVEINQLFDDMGRKLVAIEDAVINGFEQMALAFEERLLPITLTGFIDFVQEIYEAVKEQVLAFSPSAFKADVKLMFDLIKRQIAKLDPSFLVDELNQLRQQVLGSLEQLVSSILPDPKPFNDLMTKLAGLKPSELLKPLVDALKPLTELVAKIDPNVLFGPLVAGIAKIRDQLPKVIADLEAALDEVLAAFPGGGISGVSGSVSVQATA
jgi:hypothetical protein